MARFKYSKFFRTFLIAVFYYFSLAGQDAPPDFPEPGAFLSEYLKFNSESGNEGDAGRYLAAVCRKLGLHVEVFTSSDTAYNFAASVFPLNGSKPNIIFLNHLDVVPVAEATFWRHPPFAGVIENDTVWGRGCLDMKGIAVMQVLAAAAFARENKNSSIPFNVTVLCTSGEETGGRDGAGYVTEHYLDVLNPVVVLGEGGAGLSEVGPLEPGRLLFAVGVSEKRNLWIQLELFMPAQTAHGAIPTAKNATRTMLRIARRILNDNPRMILDATTLRMFRELGTITHGVKGFALRYLHWAPVRMLSRRALLRDPLLRAMVTNTIQLTTFQTPTTMPNQVPERAITHYDCRLLPAMNSEKFMDKLKQNIGNKKVEVTVISETAPAPPTLPDSFYDALRYVIRSQYPEATVIPILFPATSDLSYFREKHIPSYGIMPMALNEDLISSIHGVNERMPLSAFHRGIAIYKAFLEQVNRNPGNVIR